MSNLEFNVLKDEFPIKNKKKSNSLRSFFENKKMVCLFHQKIKLLGKGI